MKISIIFFLFSLLLSQFAMGAQPLVVSKGKLWKEKNLKIAFVSGTNEEKALIKQFAEPWTKYANVNFHFYDSLSEAPGGKAHIRIQISERNEKNPFAGDSYIGTDSLYGPNGYSMRIFIKPGEMMYLLRGVVLHEFGHALGLNHEHQHPERTYEYDNTKLIASCSKRGISESKCYSIYTETFSRWENTLLTYDPESIMHYSLDREYVKSGPEEIYEGAATLSLLDKIGIAKTYPGRISEDNIIASHEEEMSTIEATKYVKGCEITSFTSRGRTFYSYINRARNYPHSMGVPTKEGAILNAEFDPKCDDVETKDPEVDEREIKDVEIDKSDPNEIKIKTIYFPEEEESSEKCVIVNPGERTGQIYIDTYTVTMNWYVVADSKKKKNMTGTGFKSLEDAQRSLTYSEACQ